MEKPSNFELKKTLPEDKLWDYVEATFDSHLETELQNSQNLQNSLEAKIDDTENCKSCENFSKSLINTKVTISKDSTTVEIFGSNGCGKLGTNRGNSSENLAEELNEPIATQHPNTIRMYVASLLAFFSNLRIEYISDGKVYERKLPVFYGSREKLLSIEQHDFTELMNGNTNFLPRASLMLDSMQYDANRQGNKNVAVSSEMSYASLAGQTAYSLVQSSPSPYNIAVRLNLVTRGMNDAMMLVEQVASFFNPYYNFKMIESGTETSVRLLLDSVSFEPPEIDQFSANEVLVEFAFTLNGNMYKPKSKQYIVDTITLNVGSM